MNPEHKGVKFHVWIVIKKYVGEINCHINKRIYEHKKDLKRTNKNNILVKHNLQQLKFLRFFSCLNFWDKAWWFLSVRGFGLLSSSLLFFSQRFSRCILQPSSGVPCLSGHRNDLTWGIIFKVWLLIKQGIQEIYSEEYTAAKMLWKRLRQ